MVAATHIDRIRNVWIKNLFVKTGFSTKFKTNHVFFHNFRSNKIVFYETTQFSFLIYNTQYTCVSFELHADFIIFFSVSSSRSWIETTKFWRKFIGLERLDLNFDISANLSQTANANVWCKLYRFIVVVFVVACTVVGSSFNYANLFDIYFVSGHSANWFGQIFVH